MSSDCSFGESTTQAADELAIARVSDVKVRSVEFRVINADEVFEPVV